MPSEEACDPVGADTLIMRILQICSAREIGGGEKHLADLANHLVRRGHDVFAALAPASPVHAELSEVSAGNILELPMRNALNLSTAVKLARFVRANQIGIVHAHVARDYPLAALATARSQAKLVLTRHVLFPLSRIHKLTLRHTAGIIAVSQAVADSLRSQTIFDPAKIALIRNGIDFARFAQAREAAPAADSKAVFRVGTVGHLGPIKGADDFIRAAAIVCARRGDVEFVIAGEDKSQTGENRTNLQKLISEFGVDDHVRLLGWVDDITGLLPTFDLFVSAARSEPFGLAIVEAMAAAVPVIATASEGAREIIEEGQTGLLVPIGDSQMMAQAIQSLLNDEAGRQRLAVNALTVARERFSIQRMVDDTERLYAEILAS